MRVLPSLCVGVALASASCGPARGPAVEWGARFPALHRPVYEVFEAAVVEDAGHIDRDRLWEHLAKTYAGEALTSEYVETYATLRRMGEEGTRIRVARVIYDEVSPLPDEAGRLDAVTLDVRWSAGGVVRHREHQHVRVNAYEARFDVERVGHEGRAGEGGDDAWRITAVRVRDARRLGRDDARAKTEGAYLDPLDLLELLDAPAPSPEEAR